MYKIGCVMYDIEAVCDYVDAGHQSSASFHLTLDIAAD